MLSARPLYDNSADAAYYVPREPCAVVQRAVRRGLNVMLTGSRGIGKTTLLRHVQMDARGSGTRVVFVDATAVSNGRDLAVRMRDALAGRPSPLVEGFTDLRELAAGGDTPPMGVPRRMLDVVQSAMDAEPALVLIDASNSGDAVFALFGRLRDVLWQSDHTWVVAIDEDDRAVALAPPCDAFFDVIVGIDPWDERELERMIRLRGVETPSTIRTVVEHARGNPREALRLMNAAIVHGIDLERRVTTRDALEVRASRLGRSHARLMAHLLESGSASPSDDDLQWSMGVSRSRLTQLFREMLAEGLVEVGTAKPASGPGRPRTIYRARLEDR